MTRPYGPVFFTVSKKGSGLGPDWTVASLGEDIQDEYSASYNTVLKYVRLYVDGIVRGGTYRTSIQPHITQAFYPYAIC